MSPASVTLASVLQVRGEALSEEEIWSLLSLAAERLLEDLRDDSSDYVVCPWSALLSAAGSLSFQDHISHIEAAPFKAPELLQGQSDDEQPDASQPLQLCEPLHSILLTMCEDQPRRRLSLPSILEACRVHWEEVTVYPASANLHIRQLVGMVLGTISQVEQRAVEESSSGQRDRSYLLRNRLHQASRESPAAQVLGCLHPCRDAQPTRASTQVELHFTGTYFPLALGVGMLVVGGGCEATGEAQFCSRGSSPVEHDFSTTKKGKSYLALRDLSVVLLSGQCLEVKCDITSTVGAVFNAIVSFANLGELTYFGLAYLKGKEFFFLDAETRLCKIAPEGWSEQPRKRSSPKTFTLFLRIKFFVSHGGLLQHSWTRHQFYLQLRKDILEERLYCNDEMLLQLGVLALQAEFGSYPEEVENTAYFRVEDYIPASLIERMTALRVQAEVSEMHRLSPVLWGEDAELEFLRVTQQLPEYGVLVYQVLPEKTRPEGEMALGICAKGVIVYERKKFIITSSITGKKHTFVTDSAKTCKYLLGLCCAQHGFNAQMSSPGVTPDYDKCLQMANLSLAHLARSKPLSWIQRLSCSENALFVPRLEDAAGGMVQTSLDNLTVEVSKETGAQGLRGSPCPGHEQLENICLIQKPTTCDPLSGLPVRSVRTGGQILALNHISLEGFTFDMAVRMIQNSPDNVELIISQSKGVCGNTSSKEKKSTANSRVCSTDSLSDGHQGGLPSHTQDQERISEELGMARTQSLMPGLRPQLSTLPLKGAGSRPSSPSETNASEIYFVELVKEDGTLGFSVTGGINTSVPCGGIYVKSIVPGGPAAKEGRILQGPKFEVKLKKNISGLGFSFVQMEREHCGHLRNDLLRIKRLFPGQPAEENGAIAAGDIILAVNGRPTEGLDFQARYLRWTKDGSPQWYSDDEEGDVCHPPEAPPPTWGDEAYLIINSALEDQLPCGECLEADSGTIPLPQFCSWGTFSKSLPPEEPHDSESEWEDLEEAEDPDDGTLSPWAKCVLEKTLGVI
ncbi:protein tyrosine phosphatase, non-receptor type 13-like isoform 1 [Camelus ferus]|nr:protein tyrosine phosphatase, non-receptor type 13-like isoform 1 [Camelus ferus]